MKYQLNLYSFTTFISTLMICFVSLVYESKVFAQGELKAEFGEWKIHCDTPLGAKNEQCTMLQRLTSEERPNLSIQVILIKTADNNTYLMRVLTPHGVIIPTGVRLQIDNKDTGRVGFIKCLLEGCVAETIVSNDLIQDLINGEIATFILFLTPEEGIGIPLKLDGIAEGLEAINN